MVMETERTILRPFTEDDAADLFAYAHDPRVGPAAGWEAHQSIEDSREAIRSILSAPSEFAIVYRETCRIIGSAGFVMRNGVVSDELGFALHPAYWGRGIMPEVVIALLRYGFEDLGMDMVWGIHYAENVQCRRVLEKSGFSFAFQETLTDHISRETNFYVLLRQDWEARERGKLLGPGRGRGSGVCGKAFPIHRPYVAGGERGGGPRTD